MEAIEPDVLSETFHRDGYAIVREVLSPDDVAQAREVTDRYILNAESGVAPGPEPIVNVEKVVGGTTVVREPRRREPFFAELRERPDILAMIRVILGDRIFHCGNNVIRSMRGEGINHWHIDDVLECPLPKGISWDAPGVRMPVHWLALQIALSDILVPESGPTEVVPGSHFSGSLPPQDHVNPPDESCPPRFKGRGPTPVFCRAGDGYLFNHQLWHRGTVNRSDSPRYLMQQQYCQAWLHGRFSWAQPLMPEGSDARGA